MTNIEEKFQQMDTRFGEKFSGLDKRLDEMNGRLTQKEQSRSAGKAGVQEEKSGERVMSATEAGREEISQSEQQLHQWPSSSYLSLLQHQPLQSSSKPSPLYQQQRMPFSTDRPLPHHSRSETGPHHHQPPSSARARGLGPIGESLAS